MTREEAIKVLEKTVDNSVEMTMREWEEFDKLMVEAVDMAIEALTLQNLSKPNNTCEVDLISRADAVKAICDKCLEEHCETECIVPCTFMEALEAVPSSEAVPLRRDCAECALKAINRPKLDEESYERGYTEGQFANRPKGEWIGYNADKEDWLRTDGTPIFLVCDKCHGTVINNGSAHWNFCPNCGADMRKGGEEE